MSTEGSKRILSISHDVLLLSTRERLLHSAGYHVVSISSTDEVLRYLLECKVDLILLGHSVPVGERVAIIKAIHKQDVPIPVLFVSSFASQESESLADANTRSTPAEFMKNVKMILD